MNIKKTFIKLFLLVSLSLSFTACKELIALSPLAFLFKILGLVCTEYVPQFTAPVTRSSFFHTNISAPVLKGYDRRVKLPSIPTGTESFAGTMSSNAILFTDNLVTQVTTNLDTAVTQEFLTAKESKIIKRRMNKQAKVLKKAFTKFGKKAGNLVISFAKSKNKKKSGGSFGKPFKGKTPKKEDAARSRVIVARQQRTVSGLFINFYQSLCTQLKAIATSSDQTNLANSFQQALEKVLEKDIQANEKAADKALKNLYKTKGKITNFNLVARSYTGVDTFYTGGARANVSVDVTLDAVSTIFGTFGGSAVAMFDNGLTFNTTGDNNESISFIISKGGTITGTVKPNGSNRVSVKIKGKVDVKKGTIEVDILEILDEDDYTGGGIRHRITRLNAKQGSECNSFVALNGGQAKLTPEGELQLIFEEEIGSPPGGLINILSGSKDDINKTTLAEINTADVVFPTKEFTRQLTSAQCQAVNDARDFNLAVPQTAIDDTKLGDFTELANDCNVVC